MSTDTLAERQRKWRKDNPELYAAQQKRGYDSIRNDLDKWKKKLEYDRKWRARNAKKLRAYEKTRDVKKVLARNLVRTHIYRGKIAKLPCEICGAKNTHAHHDDYDKPLQVRWLCPTHHCEIHKAIENGEKIK